jgi:hypothetical protein
MCVSLYVSMWLWLLHTWSKLIVFYFAILFINCCSPMYLFKIPILKIVALFCIYFSCSEIVWEIITTLLTLFIACSCPLLFYFKYILQIAQISWVLPVGGNMIRYRTLNKLSSLSFSKRMNAQELAVLLVEPYSSRTALRSSMWRLGEGWGCPDLTKEPPGRTRVHCTIWKLRWASPTAVSMLDEVRKHRHEQSAWGCYNLFMRICGVNCLVASHSLLYWSCSLRDEKDGWRTKKEI